LSQPRDPARGDRGFSLIELTIVMVIAAVMFGLVLPKATSGLFRSDLDQSAGRLATSIAYARSRTILSGQAWELSIDLDARTFWPHPAGEDDPRPDQPRAVQGRRRLVSRVRFMDVEKLGPEGKVSAGRIDIQFQRRGLTEPVVLRLVDADGGLRTVYVKAFNGRSSILTGYVETADLP
jgi:prepilin-type N-terminal cleavage/methylation domain-containing protein